MQRTNTKLDEFLSLLQTHCFENQQIIDLDIAFNTQFSQHTERLLFQANPSIQKVENLRINALLGALDGGKFLKMLPLGSIRSIELNNFRHIDFDWLRTMTFGHLHHLYVDGFANLTNFENFFKSQPNLKTFHCNGHQLVSCLEQIAKHSSNIESVSAITIKRYNWHTNMVINSTDIVKDWLPKLDKLKTLEIQAFTDDGSDVFEILKCISEKNVLKSLAIHIMQNELIPGHFSGKMSDLNDLKHLKELYLNIPSVQSSRAIFEQFVCFVLPRMANLKKFRICSHFINQNDVLQIVKTLKNLSVLEIRLKSVKFTKAFYQKLVDTRIRTAQQTPITIFINCVGDIEDFVMKHFGNNYNERIVKIDKIK